MSVDMGRIKMEELLHLTTAGCVARSWTQQFATSPAYSAPDDVLAFKQWGDSAISR